MPLTGRGKLTPLYDSGWLLSGATTHTFTHNLGVLPLLYSLLAADDANGTNPTPMLAGRFDSGATYYGAYENGMSITQFSIRLMPDGYAYNGSAWYQRGTDYIRLLIWATE